MMTLGPEVLAKMSDLYRVMVRKHGAGVTDWVCVGQAKTYSGAVAKMRAHRNRHETDPEYPNRLRLDNRATYRVVAPGEVWP